MDESWIEVGGRMDNGLVEFGGRMDEGWVEQAACALSIKVECWR